MVASGVLVAIVVSALVSSSPMMLQYIFPGEEPKTGTLVIKLTDAPVDLAALFVNITSLEAHSDENGWVPLEFVDETSSVWIDILTLENVVVDLSITEIPPGNYTKLRLFIAEANATFEGSIEETPLKVPSEKIDIIIHFEIENGEKITLLVDMEADWVAISQTNRLRPVLKAKVID